MPAASLISIPGWSRRNRARRGVSHWAAKLGAQCRRKEVGCAGQDDLQPPAQLLEGAADMPHQRLALRAEPHEPALALEQARPQRALQLADRVAHRTGREGDLVGRGAEGSGVAGRLEGSQERERCLVQHDRQMKPIYRSA